jgi:hypothetical protein
VEYATIDVARNPAEYVATAAGLDSQGRVLLRVQNRAPIALTDITVTPVQVDAAGRIVQQGRFLRLRRALEPGEQITLATGIGAVSQEQLASIRFRVDGARAAEQ